MQKNKFRILLPLIAITIMITACSLDKISTDKKTNVDFTVVAESEMPKEVSQIVEQQKNEAFRVTYSDNENTYVIIGYGKQNYQGYSIQVKSVYATNNAICVKTEFKGPREYTNKESESFPYIVIKIEYTDKNVIFQE